jgi:hypothetical protein
MYQMGFFSCRYLALCYSLFESFLELVSCHFYLQLSGFVGEDAESRERGA